MAASHNPIKPLYHGARRRLASLWLNRFHARTLQIAITGSYGKTSTTQAISQVLARFAPTLTTGLNLDTIYNVPITALRLRGQRFIVFELGIDRPDEMRFHLQLARPRIGVITGITPVHSDAAHLGSLERIITEKRRLIEALPPEGLAVLHYDDLHVRAMAPHTRARVRWYGTDPACDYRAVDIRPGLEGTRFRLITPSQSFEVQTPLLGAHSAVNLLAAAAVAEEVGAPAAIVQAAFAGLRPLAGRLSVEPGPLGTTLLDDALRANPASTRAGLEFLGGLPARGQKIAVLGEMGELGDSAVEKHAEIGQAAAQQGLSLLVCVGELTAHTAQAALAGGMDPARVHATLHVHQAAEILRVHAHPGGLVYLKGSLMRHMERIPMLLSGKTVGCAVVSCPFYHPCSVCPHLENGYTPKN